MMSRRFFSIILIVVTFATLSGQQTRQPSRAPEPETPTFKLRVEYVEVDVRVTDSNGNFVRDLTEEDFQIFEDGEPQTVAAFSLVDLPIEPFSQVSPSVSIEPDVRSNERRFDGRIYVMILDDSNTAPDRTARTRNAARRFIEQHLGANDLMAIVFTWLSDPAQEFTSDKRLLLSAVDKFVGQEIPERTLPQPIGPAIGGVSDPVFTAAGGMEAIGDGNRVMIALSKMTAWLDGVTGRKKAVILVSDGFTYDSTKLALDMRPSGRIGRTNVNIYAVDMRGPGSVQTATSQLTMLTENTGGFVVMDNDDIGRGFDRMVAENSAYYLLAYYPSDPRDGKFHPIDVRVKRPGVTVRSRRGYMSHDGNTPALRIPTGSQASLAIVEALNSPIQLSDLRMRVFAAPFRVDASQMSVLIGIELMGRDLPLDTGGTVEISYLAVDPKGGEHGWRTDRLSLNPEPAMRTRVEQSGVRVLKRMDLPPGRYRLHVAAHDVVRGRSGSLIHDLEVPDLQASFALSGIVLLSRFSTAMVTAHMDEQIKGMLPAPPTALRTFAQNDELALYAEVYEQEGTPAHTIDITTTVRSDTGVVVFDREEAREATDQAPRGWHAYRHTLQIPLASVEPGTYVLTIETKSRNDANLRAVRHVRFVVTAVERAR
jgi:VWFA-related protein